MFKWFISFILLSNIVFGQNNLLLLWEKRAPSESTPFIPWDLEITTTNDVEGFSITPTSATNLTIVWGDGSTSNYTGSSRIEHYYVSSGTYTCSITAGTANSLLLGHDAPTRRALRRVLTDIPGALNLTSMLRMFDTCALLTSVPYSLFDNCNKVEDATYVFNLCSTLQIAPGMSGLTRCTDITRAWYGCAKVSNAPPLDAMASLQTINSPWRAAGRMTNFPALTNLITLTDITSLYYSQGSATSYPSVSQCINITSVNNTWASCNKALSFPDVSTLTNLTTIELAWKSAVSMTSCPVLTPSTSLWEVAEAYNGCTGIVGNLPALWDRDVWPNTKLDTLANHTNAFRGCSNALNWADVPAGAGWGK